MRKQGWTLGGLVAGMLLAASAEAGSLPGFVAVAETRHFVFYARADQKVEAQKVERYFGEVEKVLGTVADGKAEYYRYGSSEEIAAQTGAYVAGITYASAHQIHSTEAFHRHEIVHLVAAQMGDPGVFFQEGLAVALGNEGSWQGRDVDKLARALAPGLRFRALVESFGRVDTNKSYPLAGSFVRHLIRQYGASTVADFFRTARTERERDAAFAKVFGVSLDEAGAAWLARL